MIPSIFRREALDFADPWLNNGPTVYNPAYLPMI
tara:strand:+ start:125 stop:226 length:102 start_codon:yes stop_codon:yes gene_type:complete